MHKLIILVFLIEFLSLNILYQYNSIFNPLIRVNALIDRDYLIIDIYKNSKTNITYTRLNSYYELSYIIYKYNNIYTKDIYRHTIYKYNSIYIDNIYEEKYIEVKTKINKKIWINICHENINNDNNKFINNKYIELCKEIKQYYKDEIYFNNFNYRWYITEYGIMLLIFLNLLCIFAIWKYKKLNYNYLEKLY